LELPAALRRGGLGSVLTTTFLAHEAEVRQLLAIPDEITPITLIPVAYIKGR
jgi:hypothetical protein